MLTFEILKLLLEKPTMTFQEIFETMGCGRTDCNNTLDRLREEGLVSAEPKNWRLGQKRFFHLTEKGKKQTIQTSMKEVNRAITTFETMVAAFAADPEKKQRLRRALQEEFQEAGEAFLALPDDATTEDILKLDVQKRNRFNTPLHQSLKKLYLLYLEVKLPLGFHKEDFVMGFAKGGGFYLTKSTEISDKIKRSMHTHIAS